ncbi:MAG: leucyl aminopeptidase, partial [Pseudomonadota bacterium]
DKTKILEEKMGALYGVAQGSHHEPYVVIIEYLNSNQDTAPIALVGKGVCFDTGGISLKPANNMWDMKHDMHGSATVVGTLLALAKNKTRTNTIGIVGLVENMPGGGAQRPGDIVTSRSGQTIEMLNSDAEGRLVLADIIDYVQDIYKPKQLINYATLTGAIVVALGHEYAGLWSNNFKFANTFVESSYSTLDKYWPMPLHDTFNKGMNSSVADIKNISSPGTGAGSCTAAHFIGRFIKNKTPWIHIDIAGTAFGCVNSYSLHNGGTGFGIASTYKFIIESN